MKILIQTSGGGGAVLLVVVALLAGGHGALVSPALAEAIIALAAVVTTAVIGGIAWLVYRTRQNRPGEPLSARLVSRVPPDPLPRLENPYKPALEQPRELHLHFHGADPEQIAEILRHPNGRSLRECARSGAH
jgi:hypothetical protein